MKARCCARVDVNLEELRLLIAQVHSDSNPHDLQLPEVRLHLCSHKFGTELSKFFLHKVNFTL